MERAMKIRKKIAKLCLLLLAAGICLLAAAGIVLGVEGYALYKNGVEESPVAEKLREAQEDEDFVPFEKLPAIYVEAGDGGGGSALLVPPRDRSDFHRPGRSL